MRTADLSDTLAARFLMTPATQPARPSRTSAGRVIAKGLDSWSTGTTRTATALEPPALDVIDKAALAKNRAQEDSQDVINDLIYVQQTVAGGVGGLHALAVLLEQRTTATVHPEVTDHLRELFRYFYAVHALIDERIWQRLRHARFDSIPVDQPPPVNWPVMHTARHLFTPEDVRDASKMAQSLQSMGLGQGRKTATSAATSERQINQTSRAQFFRGAPRQQQTGRGRGRGRPTY